jgi:hypothetical protein
MGSQLVHHYLAFLLLLICIVLFKKRYKGNEKSICMHVLCIDANIDIPQWTCNTFWKVRFFYQELDIKYSYYAFSLNMITLTASFSLANIIFRHRIKFVIPCFWLTVFTTQNSAKPTQGVWGASPPRDQFNSKFPDDLRTLKKLIKGV